MAGYPDLGEKQHKFRSEVHHPTTFLWALHDRLASFFGAYPLATISEFLTIQLDPDYADDLVQRYELIAPGAIESFNGNFMHSINVSKEKFYNNSIVYLTEIACQHNLDFLVVEKEHPYPFEELYQNAGFILYQLPVCYED